MNWVSFPKIGVGKIFFNSYAFSLFGIQINFYALIFGFAVVAAVIYSYFLSEKFGVLKTEFTYVVSVGFVFGMVGARFYYVIFNLSQYFKNESFLENLLEVINLRAGGIAVYGGLIFSIAAGMVVCRLRKVKIAPMLDVISFGFLIGQSIGRWGNFFNVEAYGVETNLPWAMASNKIDDGLKLVHPTFLYESVWCCLGFVGLRFLMKYRKFDGQLFLIYIAWYSFERFFVEGLRTDSLMFFNTEIRVSQLLSFILFFAAICCLFYFYLNTKKNEVELYVTTKEWKEKLQNENFS